MYLLDTNVVSELRKVRAGRAARNVESWAHRVDAGALFLSVVSVQELQIGVLRMERRDAAQGAVLRRWFDMRLLPAFEGRILAINAAVALRSAALHVPDAHPVLDSLIAATALVHGMTVVTRNERDFVPSGVPVINPWKA